MKIYALTLLIFITGLNCFSYDNVEILNFLQSQRTTHDKSYFESLGELMTAGERHDVEDILDIPWSGRCFLKEHPNTPTNSGYIFREKNGLELVRAVLERPLIHLNFPSDFPRASKKKSKL